jgi:hypothetical protein
MTIHWLWHLGSMAITRAKVTGRKCDVDGMPTGVRNINPILVDTRKYKVEFPDGATDVFTANTIAESICICRLMMMAIHLP